MGLDFTTIKDKPGAAIFLLYEQLTRSEQKMKRLSEDIQRLTTAQVIILPANDATATKITDFYGLKTANTVLIVRDDDQLQHSWQGEHIPEADEIAHTASQVG